MHVSADPSCGVGGGDAESTVSLEECIFAPFSCEIIQFCESLYPVPFTVIKEDSTVYNNALVANFGRNSSCIAQHPCISSQ